ncbi:MAG: hypothetical protein K2Y71_29605 [Xanthobacteraceae bacterium]|nr:hypothetical protein [Xanthobacteraceae bacterium]
MDIWTTILWGAVGGIVPDILRLIRERHGEAPTYLAKWHFWLGLVLSMAVGAFVAWIFAPSKVLDAVAYGIAAPSVLQGLAADKSKEPKLSAASGLIDSWRYWWSR